MKFHFRIEAALLKHLRRDLDRPHALAAERIGFLRAGLANAGETTLLLAAEYRPVADTHYRYHPMAGASIGPDAIREALEWTDGWRGGVFHVHAHLGRGIPAFSSLDVTNNARLIPTFFNIAPDRIHGAVLLSDDCVTGAVWVGKTARPVPISRTTIVGAPLRWSFQ